MADNKKKHGKPLDKDQHNNPEYEKKNINITHPFMKELEGAFDNFNKIPEHQRVKYGTGKYLEQFREYFKEEHPNLLDKIDKKDLPVYMQAIEKKWFTFCDVQDKENEEKVDSIHREFDPKDTEQHVMEKSLKNLHDFCDDSVNNLPGDLFSKFASFAWFNPTNFRINAGSKFKTVDDLYPIWNKFLEKEGVSLTDTVANHAAKILIPDYNPTERIMVEIALNKIRKELKGKLRSDFDERFFDSEHIGKINIHSPYQDLLSFRREWLSFLTEHKSNIDEWLAKKLDEIIVTNGEIQDVLSVAGKQFDDTRWFSEWEQYFRRVFNKLATRQLFEEVQKREEIVDHYVGSMADTFKYFPPYVDEILKIYPFNDKNISVVDPTFNTDFQNIWEQISDLRRQITSAPDDKKEALRLQIVALKEKQKQRQWKAYVAFLRTKDVVVADIFAQLVANKFNFAVLLSDQQQLLVNVLVKHRLEDTIKNKVPELLSVTEEELTQFVNDLFDLKKMEITIPTRHGMVPLKFSKKEFMASARNQLLDVHDLEKNFNHLPLNFVTQLTDANAAFFEESPIFDSLYTPFTARNNTFRINDAYKVKIKKDGKIVQWYLSAYCPIDEYNIEEYDGKQLYLYTEPMTAPNQERKMVTWEWTDDGTPVVIKNNEQSLCDMEIVDKQLNLNGDAFWALLFGYVLGQQSRNQTMSPEKEKELWEKIGKLNVYKEKAEWEEEEAKSIPETDQTNVEGSEKNKFFDEWDKLKWYTFPEATAAKNKEKHGFVKWTTLLIPFAESETPPLQNGWNAWMKMEIVDINEEKWTFTTKILGGELSLGKYEGQKKEMPITAESLATLKRIFWENIYKFPPTADYAWDDQMRIVNESISKDMYKSFDNIAFDKGDFKFTLGDQKDEKVTHFGRYEQGIGEKLDQEQWNSVLYSFKHNSNKKTFTVTGEVNTADKITKYPSRDMDYATFMIFIKEKWLQPKTKKQAETMKKNPLGEDRETPTTKRPFSINNIFGFFKNTFSKVKDSIKKYDDERTEDLTDLLTSQGKLYSAIGNFLPFDRMSAGFENMGAEYFLERDSRIRKKVEKWKKFYEDADFSLIYTTILKPMLLWQASIKPHYKIAALLLAIIAKGKWPYSKNPEFTAKGMRVNVLMWPVHQARYLDMRQKLIREMEQGASTYGSIWTDNKKNEILELEMKYIVHVMDGRQMGIQDGDKTKYYFYGKYSKTFVDELETWYNKFFSKATVDEWFGKVKWASFEFARSEFFRLLSDRPQQAIPFLKTMALKAVSDSQWKTFEVAVMSGMLSGIFLTMVDSETQGMIKNICRTRGFIPGIRVKDIKQQTKLQRMLDIFSDGKFSDKQNGTGYDSKKFSYTDFSGGTNDFVKWDVDKKWIFQKWISSDNRFNTLSDFFRLKGKNENKKTLLDIYTDKDTSAADKELIQEFLDNSNERHESLDPEVRNNPFALSWSILTKSQSVVHEMMKINNDWFAGKDGDEIQCMEGFFTDMQKDIPKTKLDSPQQVKFFMDKFFNRFGEKWFSWTNKTDLVKRLKWCQKNAGKKEVNDILYYSIVGQVCSSFGHASIPPQFEGALLVWKDFFQNNLDTILQPDILTHSFGSPSYLNDYTTSAPELLSWESCVNLLDRDLKQAYMMTASPEEKKAFNAVTAKMKNENILNRPLYDLADKLYRDTRTPNRFRSSADAHESNNTKKPTSSKVTWAKIKNAQVIDKVRQILEWKQLPTSENDYVPEDPYEDPYDGI